MTELFDMAVPDDFSISSNFTLISHPTKTKLPPKFSDKDLSKQESFEVGTLEIIQPKEIDINIKETHRSSIKLDDIIISEDQVKQLIALNYPRRDTIRFNSPNDNIENQVDLLTNELFRSEKLSYEYKTRVDCEINKESPLNSNHVNTWAAFPPDEAIIEIPLTVNSSKTKVNNPNLIEVENSLVQLVNKIEKDEQNVDDILSTHYISSKLDLITSDNDSLNKNDQFDLHSMKRDYELQYSDLYNDLKEFSSMSTGDEGDTSSLDDDKNLCISSNIDDQITFHDRLNFPKDTNLLINQPIIETLLLDYSFSSKPNSDSIKNNCDEKNLKKSLINRIVVRTETNTQIKDLPNIDKKENLKKQAKSLSCLNLNSLQSESSNQIPSKRINNINFMFGPLIKNTSESGKMSDQSLTSSSTSSPYASRTNLTKSPLERLTHSPVTPLISSPINYFNNTFSQSNPQVYEPPPPWYTQKEFHPFPKIIPAGYCTWFPHPDNFDFAISGKPLKNS